jgi:MerR family mercuric resistance operon transcriptional regulator
MTNHNKEVAQEMSIGQLARLAGVHVETVRYYQRRGILSRPERRERGRRRYPTAALERLRFIKRAQQLGFSLREVADLLQLDAASCAEARTIAEQRLDKIRGRLRDLKAIERALGQLVKRCQSQAGTVCDTVCPFIGAMHENSA